MFLKFNFLVLGVVLNWLVDFFVFAIKIPIYVFSIVCVVRLPRYQRMTQLRCLPEIMPHRDELCSVCERLVDRSALITGTKWIFMRPVEKHHHHTAIDLLISAKSCHLCHLLLNSMDPTGHRLSPEPILQYGSIPVSTSTSTRDKITVKVWEERVLQGKSSLCIQLSGTGIPDALPLRVEEVHIGNYTPAKRLFFTIVLTQWKISSLNSAIYRLILAQTFPWITRRHGSGPAMAMISVKTMPLKPAIFRPEF
jgi:hypothetical protein